MEGQLFNIHSGFNQQKEVETTRELLTQLGKIFFVHSKMNSVKSWLENNSETGEHSKQTRVLQTNSCKNEQKSYLM